MFHCIYVICELVIANSGLINSSVLPTHVVLTSPFKFSIKNISKIPRNKRSRLDCALTTPVFHKLVFVRRGVLQSRKKQLLLSASLKWITFFNYIPFYASLLANNIERNLKQISSLSCYIPPEGSSTVRTMPLTNCNAQSGFKVKLVFPDILL